ncbi:glycosyltransferase [Jannaschia ovalis]|uniref:Glycosyltransferase n=1 Tax=Jannaschia ovalis TaxID=3038773 RepID=A0ABY8LFY1_9RHOB|nr:glycosyltransferase [Jannaschia sp. GRR-S6-38]WGH80216.1 glycosyltransferase [Jannaschia sp. GRR-S6-38]
MTVAGWQLFLRYASRHMVLEREGFAMDPADATGLGFVDRITWARGRFRVEGWTRAKTVRLCSPHDAREVAPDLTRADVAAVLGLPGQTALGFTVDLPWQPVDHRLLLTLPDGSRRELELPAFTEADRRAGLRRSLRPFLRAALPALPAAARWLATRDPRARDAVIRRLDLRDAPAGDDRIEASWLGGPDESADGKAPITIVLPVFNAFDLLRECLDRVERHTDLPWHLILVEDCSTDPRIRPWLQAWAARRDPDRVSLVENARNLGFVGAVNRGLALAARRDGDVVLLNSDALVPDGWASRLTAPLADRRVASVTPMSNDAEIFTAPRICRANALRPGQADAIDRRARRLAAPATPIEAPTGVGFCMAMSRRFLARVPQLDTAFGRGYGEEVDWCQRVRRLGGRNVVQPRLFVEHRGGQSFGSEAKRALIRQASALIAARYPRYDAEVQAFIAADPLRTPRLALGIAKLAAGCGAEAVPIFLAHSMGGGAELYLQRLLAEAVEASGGALVLRVGGSPRWRLELHVDGGVIAGASDEIADLHALLAPVSRRHVLYSCGVGERDPVALPDLLRGIAGPAGRITVLMNDYLPLSPSFNLMDQDGTWRGVPDADCTDPAHVARRPGGASVPLRAWRAAWGGLMREAAEIRVFSRSGRDIVASAYPGCAARITIRPHALPHAVPRLPRRPGPEVIGILGNIGPEKGAAALGALSAAAAAARRPEIVLLGNILPGHPLARGTRVHGSYAIADLGPLAAGYGITRWLIPSICPETFSFTTHEALATGLPVHCFDLGAQAEALRGAMARGAPGSLLRLEDGPEAWLAQMVGRSRPAAEKRRA